MNHQREESEKTMRGETEKEITEMTGSGVEKEAEIGVDMKTGVDRGLNKEEDSIDHNQRFVRTS